MYLQNVGQKQQAMHWESLTTAILVNLLFMYTSILFSTVAVPIYIPTTNSAHGFTFLHILTYIYCV